MSRSDTDRVSVKTYVPRYQKREWQEHADRLDMSQSEFVRTMVQAGRQGFTFEGVEPESEDADPGGQALETWVRAVLDERGPLSWDELVAELTADLEERLEGTLDDLQAADAVRYSGREGGYVRTDE